MHAGLPKNYLATNSIKSKVSTVLGLLQMSHWFFIRSYAYVTKFSIIPFNFLLVSVKELSVKGLNKMQP